MGDWAVEPLSPAHQRAEFSCGETSLDHFLRALVSQYERRRLGRTYVALRSGTQRVVGYYTLSTYTLDSEALHERGLPRYAIPAARIGRLARDVHFRGQGVGESLLRDALNRCLAVSDQIAIHAVVVDALDEHAKRSYQEFGFQELLGHPMQLFLPIQTLRKTRQG